MLFRLFVFLSFFFCMVSFRIFEAKRRHGKKNEKKPCEKTKKRHVNGQRDAMRKEEKTGHKNRHAKRRNDAIYPIYTIYFTIVMTPNT